MRAVLKNYLVPVTLVVSSLMFSASILAANTFKGNWTETFNLGSGHYVKHTPKYVSIDGMLTIGNGIMLKSLTLNNTIRLENIELITDSTKEEFVAAMGRMKVTKL